MSMNEIKKNLYLYGALVSASTAFGLGVYTVYAAGKFLRTIADIQHLRTMAKSYRATYKF